MPTAPYTPLQEAQVDGQSVRVLAVLQCTGPMASTAARQPGALARSVLLSSGDAGTHIDAQPPPWPRPADRWCRKWVACLNRAARAYWRAGERLLVDAQSKLVPITLGTIKSEVGQAAAAIA